MSNVSPYADGGGWALLNGHLVKIPPWNPWIMAESVRSRLVPLPAAWRATVAKLVALAAMEKELDSLPSSGRDVVRPTYEQRAKDAIHHLIAEVTNSGSGAGGGAQPDPNDPGDSDGPFGPWGPGGPVLQSARFMLDVAAELPPGIVRNTLAREAGKLVAKT